MGNKYVMVNIDSSKKDTPRKSIKRAGISIDFKNGTSNPFREQIQLINTKSGQYPIPIRPYNAILNITRDANKALVFITTNNATKTEIA